MNGKDIVKNLERKSVRSVPLTKTLRPKIDYLNIKEIKNNILLWKDEKEIYKITMLLDDFNKIMDLQIGKQRVREACEKDIKAEIEDVLENDSLDLKIEQTSGFKILKELGLEE